MDIFALGFAVATTGFSAVNILFHQVLLIASYPFKDLRLTLSGLLFLCFSTIWIFFGMIPYCINIQLFLYIIVYKLQIWTQLGNIILIDVLEHSARHRVVILKFGSKEQLHLPDNAVWYVDDISIPHTWRTVESHSNKFYIILKNWVYNLFWNNLLLDTLCFKCSRRQLQWF